MADDRHIVRTASFDWSQGWRGRHPFNPASEMTMLPLGRSTGLKRIGVNLICIPPGKESFIPHAHSISEEFVFVVEGRGARRISWRASGRTGCGSTRRATPLV